MLVRTSVILAAAMACSACAQDRAATLYSYQKSYVTGGGVDIEGADTQARFSKKSMSDKMLTAIALERVTGRKPDPSRLMVTN